MIIILLACIAALFVGWTLGPVIAGLPEKYKEAKLRLEAAAKESEEKSYTESKYFSTVGISLFSPEGEDKKSDRNDFLAMLATLVLPLAALITGNAYLWQFFWIAIIILCSKHIWSMFRDALFGKKK